MTHDRWRQVEDLYHRAVEFSPGERAAFLMQACQGDPELLREVTSLLDQPSGPDHILNHAALDLVGESGVVPLAVGAELGPYRIEGPLGSGGMGIVYQARDTRLGRAVALKIAARQFGVRFQREARLIASINHSQRLPYV